MAGLLPSLPSLPSFSTALPGLTTAPGSTTPTAEPAPAPVSTWGAIGEFFSLISDVQRMATIAAGIVFLLAGLRLLGGKAL